MTGILRGLKILVLEDEILIAMDVEELCLDHGAAGVTIATELESVPCPEDFDVAIVDISLNGISTLDFAARLKESGKPFIFASGLPANDAMTRRFPGIALIGKPYSGKDLIEAAARACGRSLSSGGA